MAMNSTFRSPVHNFLTTVVLVAAMVLIFAGRNSVDCARSGQDDIPPAVCLKFLKNVPRIGRRSGSFEDFYLKASKSIPRIGRRGYAPTSTKAGEWKGALDFSGAGGNDQWLSENQVRAIEQSPEIWEMISADATADSPAGAGFNSEVWQREKRTGSGQAEV